MLIGCRISPNSLPCRFDGVAPALTELGALPEVSGVMKREAVRVPVRRPASLVTVTVTLPR